MTFRDLLGNDLGPWAAGLHQSFQWWTDELARMAPPSWRRRPRPHEAVAEIGSHGPTVRLWRGSRFQERLEGRSRPLAVYLAAPREQVLTRTLVLPPLPAADLRRLAAQELDRLTPFRPEEVCFDVERLEPGDRPAGEVLLGVIRLTDLDAAVARAERFGLTPLGVGVLQGGRLRFDFLRAVRGARANRRLIGLWSAVAVLAAINVAVAMWKDMDDVAALRRAVDLQRPTVELATKLRARVEKETADRRALLARRDWNEPMRIEDAATRAFPAPQWIERMEWNGRTVRLAGFRDPNFNVLSAIATQPVLGAPRTLSNGAPGGAGAKVSFDVIAEPVRGRP
jgi:general secretion pathway protein L